MKFGVLEQVGTPEEVYYRPATPFVRDFLGKTFLLPGKISAVADPQISVEIQGMNTGPLILPQGSGMAATNGKPALGQRVMIAIRPEQIAIIGTTPDGRPNSIQADLEAVHFLGDRYEYTVQIGAERRVLVSPAARQVKRGDRIYLELKPEGVTLWPRD
jgi:ABC-type Fe3+/spermidine/putrescine transport system ATPase subunit